MVEDGQTTTRDESASAGAETRRFGVHAEVALVTGVLLLLGVVISDWFTFFALAPSPLLLPVLWGALRGGLMPAITATILVGSLHTLGAVVAADQDLAVLTVDGFTWPLFAFAVVAFVVGQTRDLLARRLSDLRAARERLHTDASRQRRDLEVLGHANRELKRRIFDRSFDFDSLVSTVARSSIDDDEHMFELPLGMLVDYCGATKCSVLLVLPDETLDLAGHRGWRDDEIGPRLRVANNSARVLRAIVEAQPIVDLPEDEGEAFGPLLIAPIADATGVIKALVCIDEMPPSRFDEGSIKTFLGVVSWLATNLRRIQMREATSGNSQQVLTALDTQKYLGSVADLSERIYLEDARRRRYGIETELVAIRLMDVRVNMADYVDLLEQHLVKVLSSAARLTDDIFKFGFAGCYVLVLTGCKQGNGEGMIARLAARFSAHERQEIGPVDLCHFAPTAEAPTLADLLDPLTDHFCGASPVPLAQECPVPEPRAQRSGNAPEFARRLRLETDLARRLGLELNMIDYRSDGPEFGVGPMIARHLWNSVGTLLRVTDGIYVVDSSRCVVLLPCTSCLDASGIWARLEESLRDSLPSDRYEGVRAEFLALDSGNLRETVEYFAGGSPLEGEGERQSPIITESELEELAFSDAEFAHLQHAGEDLEKDFRVLATTGANMPRLPSPQAMSRRWEEVFGPEAAEGASMTGDSKGPKEPDRLEAADQEGAVDELQAPASVGEVTDMELRSKDVERRVITATGPKLPALPSPEAMAQRFDEVFKDDSAETVDPGEADGGEAGDRGPTPSESKGPAVAAVEPTVEPRNVALGEDLERDLRVIATIGAGLPTLASPDSTTRPREGMPETGEGEQVTMMNPKDTACSEEQDQGCEAPRDLDEWRADVGVVVEELAGKGAPFTSADVRAHATRRGIGEPPHPSAWGFLMAGAAKRGLIEKTGREVESEVMVRQSVSLAEWVGTEDVPDAPASTPQEAFGDQETMRLLLSQIEGLRALCMRLGGQLPGEDPRG